MEAAIPQKAYARHYKPLFYNNPDVFRYQNEAKTKKIDILSGQYLEFENIVFYSTIGLSLYDFGIKSNNKDLRIELISAFYKDFEEAGNLLSHCAFNIIDYKELAPNIVLPNIIKEYSKSDMSEIWIKYPNLLQDDFITMEFDEYYITVLQIMPISITESEIVINNGGNTLEKLFQENNVDQYDISRKSIL